MNVEQAMTELEQKADAFARALAADPGACEADGMWLRINQLRDRIIYAFGEARTEVKEERARRLDALHRGEIAA